MNNYYIFNKNGTTTVLFKELQRQMGEISSEITARCLDIIRQAEKHHKGEFFFMDRTSLQASNLAILPAIHKALNK